VFAVRTPSNALGGQGLHSVVTYAAEYKQWTEFFCTQELQDGKNILGRTAVSAAVGFANLFAPYISGPEENKMGSEHAKPLQKEGFPYLI
jgi:hypothetical protein